MGFPRNDVNVGPKDLRCSLAAPGLHRYTVLVAPGVVRKCNGYSKTLYVTLCDYGTGKHHFGAMKFGHWRVVLK